MTPPTDDLHMITGAVIGSVVAAHRTGLLAALLDAPDTPDAFAARLSVDARACHRVLDVLANEGIAARDGDRYGAGPALRGALAGGMLTLDQLAAFWGHVPAFLADGATVLRADGPARDRGASYRGVVAGLGRRFEPAAATVADDVAAHYPAARDILDVGAGSGVWSLAMASRHDGARVLAVDLPEVVEVTRAWAAERGLADRVAVRAGDYRDAEVPEAAFDRVVMANVLHLEPPDVARDAVVRWARALRPGGVLLIIDVVSDETAPSERLWAAYALHLAMRSAQGYPHREPALRAWLSEAGLRPAPRLGTAGHAVIPGVR